MKATKLASGNYNVRFRVNGKVCSITRPTKAEALRDAALAQTEQKTPVQDLSLAQACTVYINDKEAVLSPSTVLGYKRMAAGRFQALMPRQIRKITPQQWQTAISAETALVSAKTIKNAWGFITAVLNYNGFPAPDVNLPQVVRAEKQFLQPEQIQPFLDALRGDRVEIPALLALHGLRRSELLALDRQHLDLVNGLIRVTGAVVESSDGFVHKDTNKTASSNRLVPIMIPRLTEALKALPADAPLVDYHPNDLIKAVNRVCRKAGVPEVGVHGLRHSFASLCYHLGVPEKVCMKLGGWSDSQTMRNIYQHLADRDLGNSISDIRNFFALHETLHEEEQTDRNPLRRKA